MQDYYKYGIKDKLYISISMQASIKYIHTDKQILNISYNEKNYSYNKKRVNF